jgi:hypothetical protein
MFSKSDEECVWNHLLQWIPWNGSGTSLSTSKHVLPSERQNRRSKHIDGRTAFSHFRCDLTRIDRYENRIQSSNLPNGGPAPSVRADRVCRAYPTALRLLISLQCIADVHTRSSFTDDDLNRRGKGAIQCRPKAAWRARFLEGKLLASCIGEAPCFRQQLLSLIGSES